MHKFYKVIAAPMLMCGRVLRCLSGCALAGHVCNMTNVQCITNNALEERIQDYKHKWHNHILRMDSPRRTQKAKNYQADRRESVG
jgi:hypothetical protein